MKDKIEWAEQKIVEASDDGDDGMEKALNCYQEHCRRERKSIKITMRSASIDTGLRQKLEDVDGIEHLQIFHVSSSDYLKWISRTKIPFYNQPDLTPKLTGILDLRRYFNHIPAPINHKDTHEQVSVGVNSYLEKIARIVNQHEKTEDYNTLAVLFKNLKVAFTRQLETEVHELFRKSFEVLTIQNTPSKAVYRQNINDLIERWLLLYLYATFNKILKESGRIAKGASKANCLADGCDWDMELSAEFSNHLGNWFVGQDWTNETLGEALSVFCTLFFDKVLVELEHSNSDVSAIAIARAKWLPFKHRILAQVDVMLRDLAKKQSSLHRRGIMADRRQNSLIPALTAKHFIDVYSALPAQKPSSTEKKRRYVEGKFSFQKRTMRDLFMRSDMHIFDQATQLFYEAVSKHIPKVLSDNLSAIFDMMDIYQQELEDFIPTEYIISPRGEKIRAELRALLPTLQKKALEVQSLVPFSPVSIANDAYVFIADIDQRTYEKGLSFFITRAAAAKPLVRPRPAKPRKNNKSNTKIRKRIEEEDEEPVFLPETLSAAKKNRSR